MSNTTNDQPRPRPMYRYVTAIAENEICRRVFKLTATQLLSAQSGVGAVRFVFSCEGTVLYCADGRLSGEITPAYAQSELEHWLAIHNDVVDAALEWPRELLTGSTVTTPGPIAALQQMVDEARAASESLCIAAAARFRRASQVCGRADDQVMDAAVMARIAANAEGFLREGHLKAAAAVKQGAIAEALSNAVTRLSASYGAVIEEVRAFKNWAAEDGPEVVRETAGLAAHLFGLLDDDRAAFEHGYEAGFRDGVVEWGQEQMRTTEEAACAAVAAEVWVMPDHRTAWVFGYVRGYESVAQYNAATEANYGPIRLSASDDPPKTLGKDSDYILHTIAGVEYLDIKARCERLDDNGHFKFIMQVVGPYGYEDSNVRFELLRATVDRRPGDGMFGLPEYKGEAHICECVHTVRMRVDLARFLGMTWAA